MSDNPSTHIGTGDWFEANPKRFGIYNADYIDNFEKWRTTEDPWAIAAPKNCDALGKRFATYEAAATYLREEVLAK